MRFKLDECLDVRLAGVIRGAGFQVETVGEEGLGGSNDVSLYHHCVKERMTLLTQDMDFSNPFRFPPQPSVGIIVLRNPTQLLTDAAALIRRLLPEVKSRSPEGHLWVVGRGGIRLWPSSEGEG